MSTAGPTIARNAYTGSPFVVNRQYADRFGDDWIILSAKFGFVDQDFVISEPYNVSFKDKRSNPVGIDTLRAQVSERALDRYDRIIVLGGKDYAEPVKHAFDGMNVESHYPFLGLRIGNMLGATKQAISAGSPIPH